MEYKGTLEDFTREVYETLESNIYIDFEDKFELYERIIILRGALLTTSDIQEINDIVSGFNHVFVNTSTFYSIKGGSLVIQCVPK